MKKLFGFMRQSFYAVIIIGLLLVFQAICDLTLVSYLSDIINLGIKKDNMDFILQTGGKMIGVAFISMCIALVVCYFAANVAAKIGRDLKSRIFKKVVSFSNMESDKFSTASLITRSTNDVQQVQLLIVLLLRTVVYAPILGIGGIIKILTTNVFMAWIVAVTVVVAITVLITLFSIVVPKFISCRG